MQNTKKTNKNIRIVAGCGMLSAAATVLQYLEIPSPISFITLDFSDLPALLGAYAYGPVAGILIQFIKNLIHLAVSRSGYIGELSNFILGSIFCVIAGLIYKRSKTKKNAVTGGAIGAVAMGGISFFTNVYVVYPFYYSFMPKEAVLDIYQKILNVSTVEAGVLIFNVPFTIIKGLLCVAIASIIYKPLSPFLHGRK